MRFHEPTPALLRAWKAWVRKLPKAARAAAERFDPWTLYRLKTTGDRVTVCSFADDATVTVIVSGRWNLVLFDRQVFGIQPDELEECDLPGPDEMVGTVLTQDQAKKNMDVIKATVRPDLWTLDENGNAVRKQ